MTVGKLSERVSGFSSERRFLHLPFFKFLSGEFVMQLNASDERDGGTKKERARQRGGAQRAGREG